MAGLIPLAGGGQYFLYEKRNPRLSEILLSQEVHAVVDEWLMKVQATYMSAVEARTGHRGARATTFHFGADSVREGDGFDDEDDVHLANSVDARSFIGGYENDRWVGEITVHTPYAMADEFGRKKPAEGQHGSTTEGHHTLRDSLYANLPQI